MGVLPPSLWRLLRAWRMNPTSQDSQFAWELLLGSAKQKTSGMETQTLFPSRVSRYVSLRFFFFF